MPPPHLRPSPLSLFLPFHTPLRPYPRPTLHAPPSLHHQPPLTRPASHASQGRANKAAPGPGKRLGAKKGASELVVPGNIIFRQRGTHWFPGENCGMGRDHTIFAKEKGYVVFYSDNMGRKGGEGKRERKYIGVVFRRGETLPRGRGMPRVRRLGMVGRERDGGSVVDEESIVGEGLMLQQSDNPEVNAPQQSIQQRTQLPQAKTPLELRPGYQFRESNWHIGRAAERANVRVREYKRGDRFLAWRKLNARKARNAERRALSSRKKKGNAKRK